MVPALSSGPFARCSAAGERRRRPSLANPLALWSPGRASSLLAATAASVP